MRHPHSIGDALAHLAAAPAPEPPADVDPVLLTDVRDVLAAAATLLADGWTRSRPTSSRVRRGALTVLDAIDLAADVTLATNAVQYLARTCAAMAVEPLTDRPAHELLADVEADAYLSPTTPDDVLAGLDVCVLVAFNRAASGLPQVRELLATADRIAPHVIAAQTRRVTA